MISALVASIALIGQAPATAEDPAVGPCRGSLLVVGGSSAGATVQGSYPVRGAVDGPDILMAKGHEQGFGHLQGVAIDQHLLPRDRVNDLVPVVGAHPEPLGVGIDESTAIVVDADQFEVIGRGVVGIDDGREHDGRRYDLLASGERFDLKGRRRLATVGRPEPPPLAEVPKGRSGSDFLSFKETDDRV